MIPELFYEQVVETYWERLREAGARLQGAYTSTLAVADNSVLPLPQNVSTAAASRQANVYLHEFVALFLRRDGRDYYFLDWDSQIQRSRWVLTKEPPDAASLLRQYFDGLHHSRAYLDRWADGMGGGVPAVSRGTTQDERAITDTPFLNEFHSTFSISLSNIGYDRPDETVVGPTIEPHQAIFHDFMLDIETGERLPIPVLLAARDKVAGTQLEPDPEWYEEGESLEGDMDFWHGLFVDWLVGRVGHEQADERDPTERVERFARSLLGCLFRLPGDDSFPYIYGSAGTGKSLVQNSFSNMAGEYNTEIPRSALLRGTSIQHSSNTIDIYRGARVAIVKEAKDDKGEIDCELIKDITSYEPGRTFSVRAAYDAQPRQYTSAAKPMFLSNDSPSHLLDSEGIDRRMVKFSFLSKYVQSGKADRSLPKKLVTPRFRCALINYLLRYRESFVEKLSVPTPGENIAGNHVSVFDCFQDLLYYKRFVYDSWYEPRDAVTSKELQEMMAFQAGYESVDNMRSELSFSAIKLTKDIVIAISELVAGPIGEGRVELQKKSRGGAKVLLNVRLTDKGKEIYDRAKQAFHGE